jgi:transposase
LSVSTSQLDRKPMVVIDAGIATEDNLVMLKSKGFNYLCVTRSKLKNYILCNENTPARQISDRKGNLIEIQMVKPEIKKSKNQADVEEVLNSQGGDCDGKQEDSFLYVRSEQKGQKEASMENRFSQRLEEELENLSNGLSKKGTTKKLEKVCERLGRIKERYAYAAKFYTIEVLSADDLATKITWTKKDNKPSEYQGVYFLRSSKQDLKEEDMWTIYNTLTEIEATFRILKTDLSLRPVHHQSDANCEAHLFLGVLAYAVVATIRYQLKQKGINDGWSNIMRKMSTQKRVITTMTNNKNQRIFITTCSKPIHDATLIYDALGFKHAPFQRKKFVLPE